MVLLVFVMTLLTVQGGPDREAGSVTPVCDVDVGLGSVVEENGMGSGCTESVCGAEGDTGKCNVAEGLEVSHTALETGSARSLASFSLAGVPVIEWSCLGTE